MNIKHFLPILILGFIPAVMSAQSSPVSSGGTGEGSGGSFTYSLGQTFYHVAGWNITFSEGVQQPYEISIYSIDGDMVEEIDGDISLSVYPNPTIGMLSLVVETADLQGFEFSLMDISGQVIDFDGIFSTETVIDMSSQPPATYLLRITRNKKDVKTFKIVKK